MLESFTVSSVYWVHSPFQALHSSSVYSAAAKWVASVLEFIMPAAVCIHFFWGWGLLYSLKHTVLHFCTGSGWKGAGEQRFVLSETAVKRQYTEDCVNGPNLPALTWFIHFLVWVKFELDNWFNELTTRGLITGTGQTGKMLEVKVNEKGSFYSFNRYSWSALEQASLHST